MAGLLFSHRKLSKTSKWTLHPFYHPQDGAVKIAVSAPHMVSAGSKGGAELPLAMRLNSKQSQGALLTPFHPHPASESKTRVWHVESS